MSGRARRGARRSCLCRRRRDRIRRRRALASCSGAGGSFLEQGVALIGAEPLYPARVGDADLLHQPTGLDLAQPGERLQHGKHLHLPDDVVAVGLVEHLTEGDRAHLQLVLDLGPLAPGGGRLLQGGLTPFGREGGRQRHGRNRSRPDLHPLRPRDGQVTRSTAPARDIAAATRSGASVTARPTTRRSAPATMASSGAEARAWSCDSSPGSRMPGTTATSRGASCLASRTSAAEHTMPAQPASTAAATRLPRMCGGAPSSLVRTVTAMAAGGSSPARSAPKRSPSTPARSMSVPPCAWSVT